MILPISVPQNKGNLQAKMILNFDFDLDLGCPRNLHIHICHTQKPHKPYLI